ncbi:o-succinylbenzoate--CoA ligase [Vibrio rumoiensis]|uniref:O-succinylbenzoate--CoA ligase n=1 Tax=Vibrio rumoiensis 1S-45 TaxID=1188252 RepID=A0A1E5E3W2_9VIBR|nr:o-succinylbenzoate--CoA ligase [Vibrio rumoiensis]OEF26962.1 o-succinylbenzoate--CoA ligase [Vibrio rumoiensis 1S-45]
MDIIQKWAQAEPNKIAFVTPTQGYSWKVLDDTIDALSYQLAQQQVQQGSVIGLISKNEPKAVLLYLACLRLGALCAFMPPQPLKAIQQKITIIQADLCWLGDSAVGIVPSMECPMLSINFDAISAQGTLTDDVFDDTQPASIVFTSGSTGAPKAVVHCVKHHLASAQGLTEHFQFDAEDSWLLSLPIYHVSGLSILWRWLCKGAQLVMGSGELIKDLQQVTHASLVPTQLQRLLEQPYAIKVKRVLLGGGHIPLSLTQAASEQGIECWVGYGMTETASTVIAKKVDGSPTSGFLLPNRKIKVESGRIFVAGDTLALGYLVEGKLTPLISDQSPWFDTKDLGLVHCRESHADEIEILGRVDNQFISGGENIHCEEVESALNRHPNIKQAMVLPIPDAQFGQRPIAFIEYVSELPDEEYQTFLLQYIDKFKCPDVYYALPNSLMNTGIKLSRSELKRYYHQHYSNDSQRDKL